MTTTNRNIEANGKAQRLSLASATVLVVITLIALGNSDMIFDTASFEVYLPFLFNAFPKKRKSKEAKSTAF